MKSRVTNRDLTNALAHTDHLIVLAGGSTKQRRQILDRADERLVRALSSAARIAHVGGSLPSDVYKKHGRKLEIAVSPTRALRTKHKLVVSERGAGFWSSIAKAALPIIGGVAGGVIGPVSGALGSVAGKALASAIP